MGIVIASLPVVAGLQLEAAVRSDVGRRRTNNEDSVFASPRLVAVADGVGGAVAGEVASGTVIDALHHLDKCRLDGSLDDALAGAIAAGNDTIAFLARAQPELAGMSTTLTAVALHGTGYVVANVGDSRTYLLRHGDLERLTRDDSWVQEVTESGVLSADEARTHPYRSVVLAALDGDPRRTPALRRVAARAGDRLLLCSDGLSDFVDDGEIAEALAIASREDCADRLIDLALATGGRDNVSVVVADATERAGDDSLWS
jgi:protein phosphatase